MSQIFAALSAWDSAVTMVTWGIAGSSFLSSSPMDSSFCRSSSSKFEIKLSLDVDPNFLSILAFNDDFLLPSLEEELRLEWLVELVSVFKPVQNKNNIVNNKSLGIYAPDTTHLSSCWLRVDVLSHLSTPPPRRMRPCCWSLTVFLMMIMMILLRMMMMFCQVWLGPPLETRDCSSRSWPHSASPLCSPLTRHHCRSWAWPVCCAPAPGPGTGGCRWRGPGTGEEGGGSHWLRCRDCGGQLCCRMVADLSWILTPSSELQPLTTHHLCDTFSCNTAPRWSPLSPAGQWAPPGGWPAPRWCWCTRPPECPAPCSACVCQSSPRAGPGWCGQGRRTPVWLEELVEDWAPCSWLGLTLSCCYNHCYSPALASLNYGPVEALQTVQQSWSIWKLFQNSSTNSRMLTLYCYDAHMEQWLVVLLHWHWPWSCSAQLSGARRYRDHTPLELVPCHPGSHTPHPLQLCLELVCTEIITKLDDSNNCFLR